MHCLYCTARTHRLLLPAKVWYAQPRFTSLGLAYSLGDGIERLLSREVPPYLGNESGERNCFTLRTSKTSHSAIDLDS